MKKLIERLLIFFLGLPLLLAIVIFLPHKNHLCLNILIFICGILGALEFQNILKQKNLFIPPLEAAILGSIFPVLAILTVSFNLIGELVFFLIVMAAAIWLIVARIFSNKEEQGNFINRTAAGFMVMIYPGLFLSWIVLLSSLYYSEIIIAAFLLMVFLNDSIAWTTGKLFGKNNRGFIPASPNKSIAGFAGGLLASVAAGLLATILFPNIFISVINNNILAGIILGLLTGLAAILGDLGESVLKRSAGIKDSGFFIPGRGGILDSIDSIALAAPVYYFALIFLFFV